MDIAQQKWSQPYFASLGAKEPIRLSCAAGIWEYVGVASALAIALTGRNEKLPVIVMAIFTLSIFVLPFLNRWWEPAHSRHRVFVGKQSLPDERMPRSTTKVSRQPRPWRSYLPGIWRWSMLLLMLYAVIKYLSK